MSNNQSNGKLEYGDEQADEQFDRSLAKEAERVVTEIKYGVEQASVSSKLETNDLLAYINIRTLEHEDWCVELTNSGYMVVSRHFDTIDAALKEENTNKVNKYETFEALMHKISPLFVKKFNDSVAEKLAHIA